MLVIGIDPGLSGACSVFDHNGLKAVFDIPRMRIPGVGPTAKVKDKVDARELLKAIRQHWPADEKAEAVMEQIQTNGGAGHGIQTQASLLRTVGAIEAVIECLRAPLTYIPPKRWQKFYGMSDVEQKDRKKASLEKARTLYPACEAIALAKHHNRAEAILLGHMHLRKADKAYPDVPF